MVATIFILEAGSLSLIFNGQRVSTSVLCKHVPQGINNFSGPDVNSQIYSITYPLVPAPTGKDPAFLALLTAHPS